MHWQPVPIELVFCLFMLPRLQAARLAAHYAMEQLAEAMTC